MRNQHASLFPGILIISVFLMPLRAAASATVTGGSGNLNTRATIGAPCDCNPRSVIIEFPASAGNPSSGTQSCPRCEKTALNTSGESVTGFVGATQVDASFSGDDHFLTFQTKASGGADSNVLAPENICGSGGSIGFTISGQPEIVAISVSISVSGENCVGTVNLTKIDNGEVLGRMSASESGTQGSITGGLLGPGQYTLSAGLGGFGNNISPGAFGYTLTMSVSAGGAGNEFHWINPAGGAFDTGTNWDLQQVPAQTDKAIFDLPGGGEQVPITANNNVIARMVIRKMNVDLNGPVQAAGPAGAFGFEVDDGGTLVLDNGVSFITTTAVVGNQTGAESSVLVSGNNTKWSCPFGEQLLIGNAVPGKVVVDSGGLLSSGKNINVGATAAGTLRVESGGKVLAPACSIVNGSVEISDTDTAGNPSSLELSGSATGVSMIVGHDANTQVEVKDGGLLKVDGQAEVGEGHNFGKLLVHGKSGGKNASCNITGTPGGLRISSQVLPSELIVTDGGRVQINGEMAIGTVANERGTASISGSDSSLTCSFLTVGVNGGGEMTISDGAHVTTNQDASVGATARGIIETPPPTDGGSGDGFVTINSSFLNTSVWKVSGNCLVGQDEPGHVRLTGTLSFLPNGVGGGVLRVDGTLTVGPHGIIDGNGKLIAGNRVVNGGQISPGLSPGVISIEGNYEQTADGVLKIEIAGLDDGQFDVLNVTGDATLGGTLEVHMLDGFLPKAGDSADFLQVTGNVTGNFVQITFPELAPGFNADLALASDGKLRLTARSDALAGSGATITSPQLSTLNAPTPSACGAGACGSGAAMMVGLTMMGLALMRRSRHLRQI